MICIVEVAGRSSKAVCVFDPLFSPKTCVRFLGSTRFIEGPHLSTNLFLGSDTFTHVMIVKDMLEAEGRLRCLHLLLLTSTSLLFFGSTQEIM